MRVIFHVGPHKTGTTAIQFFLDRHRSELASKGVHVPKPLTGFPGHHEISWSLLGWNLRTVGASRARFSVLGILAREIRRADGQGCSVTVFSSEDFSLLEPRHWKKILRARWLASHIRRPVELTVAYSRRNLFDLVSSAYPTIVRHGATLSFEDCQKPLEDHFTKTYKSIESLRALSGERVHLLEVPYKKEGYVKDWVRAVLPGVDSGIAEGFELVPNPRPPATVVSRWVNQNKELRIPIDLGKPFHWSYFHTSESLQATEAMRTSAMNESLQESPPHRLGSQ